MLKMLSTNKRLLSIGLLISLLLFLLIIRLAHIQIVKASEYSQKAHRQRMLAVSIEKLRGDILDRNGIPFTKGKERSYLLLFPGLLREDDSVVNIIQSMTGMTKDEIMQISRINTPYIKKEIIRSIAQGEIDIESGKYPGIMIIRERTRYDNTSLARHVIGYLNKSDMTPAAGIEKEYNRYLDSDSSMMMYAITDARKHVIPGVGFKIIGEDKTYYNVRLTLDYYIQKALEDALDRDGGRGGGVVIDVKTGDILAMASRPNFEQNNVWASINKDDSLWAVPSVAFPPGSVFKIVVAAAALEAGICDGDTPYTCTGEITINGVTYSCHSNTGGLGEITIREAFAHSCNDAFIKLAQELGGKKIIEMARRLGFASSLDIGLMNEAGELPDRAEYAGAGIGNLALGQGKIEATPLQIANMISIIANDGIRKNIGLVNGLLSRNGELIQDLRAKGQETRVLSPEVARELREWMKSVTKYGTGVGAYSYSIGGTAGKTGTPQIAGDPNAKYYGWFAGFFPADQPRYVIVILSREESSGGARAATIFKETAEAIHNYTQKLEKLQFTY